MMGILPGLALICCVTIVAGAVCPDRWITFQGSCYIFVDEMVTWSTASEICRTVHSGLVEVDSAEENAFIAQQLRNKHLSGAWLGLNDFVEEGTWMLSSTGDSPAYTNWAPGEPNDMAGHGDKGEDCVQFRAGSGQWDDYWCDDSHVNAAVCEKPMTEEEVVG